MQIEFSEAKIMNFDAKYLCLKVEGNQAENFCDSMTAEKPYVADLKQYRQRRSLDANAAAWVLCQNIATVIGVTKEEVYRRAIKDIGEYTYLAVKEEALNQFIANWESGGIGRLVQIVADSKWDGYIKIMAYFGSSTYDTAQMSRLIDYLNEEAKEVGAEQLIPSDMRRLLDQWEKDHA